LGGDPGDGDLGDAGAFDIGDNAPGFDQGEV
jgi:hypothetical protein